MKCKCQFLLLVAMIGLPITGCSTPPRGDGPHPAWPAPPAEARIIHRRNLQTNADFGGSGFGGLGELLTGRVRQGVVAPSGVALDGKGNIFIADRDLQGIHVFQEGSRKSSFIQYAGSDALLSPVDIEYCDGLLAVSDSAHRAVFLVQPDGKFVRRLDKPGKFKRPTGLAYDRAKGMLYVVDTEGAEVCGFDMEGRMLVHFGAPGGEPGQFNRPTHITIDDNGRLYVVDSMNFRIQTFTREGRVLFTFGKQGNATGFFGVPKGIDVDKDGNIYVVDSYFCAVQIFDAKGRFLLAFGSPGEENGQMMVPTNLLITRDNLIYLCDSKNARVQVFEYLGGPDDEQAQPDDK